MTNRNLQKNLQTIATIIEILGVAAMTIGRITEALNNPKKPRRRTVMKRAKGRTLPPKRKIRARKATDLKELEASVKKTLETAEQIEKEVKNE